MFKKNWKAITFLTVIVFTFVSIAPTQSVFADGTWYCKTISTVDGSGNISNAYTSPKDATTTFAGVAANPVAVNSVIKVGYNKRFSLITNQQGIYMPVTNAAFFSLTRDTQNGQTVDIELQKDTGGGTNDYNAVVKPKSDLSQGTHYYLTVSPGVAANNSQNKTLATYIYDFWTEISKPSCTAAILNENTLTLKGLPQDAGNLEYCFSDNNWKHLNITGTEAALDVTDLGLIIDSSTIQVRVEADSASGAPAGSIKQRVVTSTIMAPDAPAAGTAVFSGTKIMISGLSLGKKNYEYRVSLDRTNYDSWSDLTIPDNETSVLIDTAGLSIIPGISRIDLRVKEDAENAVPVGSIKTLVIYAAFNSEMNIAQGNSYPFEGNVKIAVGSLTAKTEGISPTVTFRNASAEIPSNMTSMQTFVRLHGAGGVYGLNIKGASSGTVVISLPVYVDSQDKWILSSGQNLTAQDVRDTKVGVWMLDKTSNYQPDLVGSSGGYQYAWTFQSSVDRSEIENNIIKVTAKIDSDNQDIVYGVFYDQDVPEAPSIAFVTKDAINGSVTMQAKAFEESRVTQYNFIRTDLTTGEIKAFSVTRAGLHTDTLSSGGIVNDIHNAYGCHYFTTFADSGINKDHFYKYQLESVVDEFGNMRPYSTNSTRVVTLMPDAEALELMKASLLPNIENCMPPLAQGDTFDSVTQSFTKGDRIFRWQWMENDDSNISWGADNTEIMPIPGVIDLSKLTTSAVTINLCAYMQYGTASYVHKIPLTIRMTPNTVIRSDAELLAAISNPEIKTMTFCIEENLYYQLFMGKRYDHSSPTGTSIGPKELDFKGKTVRILNGSLPPFTNTSQEEWGSTLDYKICNAVIDLGGQAGTSVFKSYYGGNVTLENVQVINADNYSYIVNAANGKTTITNCTFGACKVAAISKGKDTLEVSNCTFAGGGEQSGTGIQSYADTILNNNRLSNFRENAVSIGAGGSLTTCEANSISGCNTAIQVCIDSEKSSYITAGGIQITDKTSAENAFKTIKNNNTITDIANTIAVRDGAQYILNESSDIFSAAITPAASSTGVAINSKVGITFSKKMDASTINNNSIKLLENGKVLAAKVTYDPETTTAAIETAAGSWKYNSTYSITLTKSVQDMDGKNLAVPITWTFSTENYTNYILLMPTAENAKDVQIDATLRVGFMKPINGASITSGAAVILQTANGSKVDSENSLNPEGTTLTIKPKKALDYGVNYQIVLPAALTDTDGKSELSDRIISFTTQTSTVENFCLKSVAGNILKTDASNPGIVNPGEKYYINYSVTNHSNTVQKYMMYMVVRGGKGAREDCGGQVLYSYSASYGNISNIPLYFNVPKDITGNLYVDIYTRGSDSEAQGKPAHYLYKIAN